MSIDTPSPEILDAAAQGEARARDRVVEAMLPTVLGWTARMGGPSVDAEDAAHDVCIVALDRLHTLRDPGAFPAWVYGITRRVLVKHRRRARWSQWLPLSTWAPPAVEPRTDDLGGVAFAVLDTLPPKQREVLVLCAIEERTCEEAAEILSCPVGTVKSRLRLARARFGVEARAAGVYQALASYAPEAT